MDCIQLSLFGKTYPEHSPAILGETLEPCSKKSHKPIFQCLEVNGGRTPEWFEAKGFTRRGASSTVNIGVSPSVAKESFLSEVLEPIVPKKYHLTAIACAGILRRAEKRGKIRSPILEKALKSVIPLAAQAHPPVLCVAGFIDKAPSNARGIGYEAEKSATLRAGVIPSTVYAIDRAAFNQGKNAKYDFEITENDVNPTLVSKGPSAVCYGFPLGFRAENTNIYNECATTICNGTRPGFCNGVCYNICSDKSNVMLSDNPYSGIYETDVTRTLDGNGGNPACNQGGTMIVQELIDWIVRRLTPRECERLQGYPDDWTVLPKISDMHEADYLFFRDVFCTYRAINGKPVKKRRPRNKS